MQNSAASNDKQRGLLSLTALRPYLNLLRGQLWDYSILLLLMGIATAVSLTIPLIAGRFVDEISGSNGAARWTSLGILGGLLVLQLVGTFFSTVISARLGLRTITRLRRRLFAHLIELPALYFTKQKAGDLSSRMTSDVGSIQYLLTSGIIGVVRALLTLIGALVLMLHLNARLTVVVLVLIPSTILLVRLFGSRLQKLSRRMYDELGLISSHVQEVAGAIRVVKVFNNQAHEQRRFDGLLDTYLSAGLRRAWLSAALESGAQTLLWICLICVVIYGFYLTAQGGSTYGQLVAFLLLAFRVAVPLASLTSLYSSAQGAVAAVGRLDDVLAVAPERLPGAAIVRSGQHQGAVALENVAFSYREDGQDAPVLVDLSLSIAPGEKVAVVGPSGAGKTTLTGLILRLFDPQHGRLLLDGRPYTSYELTDLRGQMAYVSQDPILYDVSIEENIRFGLDDIGAEAVRAAAQRANALEFITALPDGFETACGERGSRLSGGERQRIALARAFLPDPGILVLDEPTSALDARSEEAVRAALRSLMRDRTAIVIAHRLSLVRDLDRILVLDRGRLVEQGNHEELLQHQGLYRTLYHLQHGSS